MIKAGVISLTLGIAAICSAQTSTPRSPSMQPAQRHVRLTFVLTYPQGTQPSQTFALDVPVSGEAPGTASMILFSSPEGQPQNAVEESLRCSDVRFTPTGVAASVEFTTSSISGSLTGSTEPVHHRLMFNKKFEVAFGKATPITQPMRLISLHNGNQTDARIVPASPNISVTATVI